MEPARALVVGPLLTSGLLPALLAGGAAMISVRLGRAPSRTVLAAGLVAGWWCAQWGAKGLPSLPPREALEWLPWIAVLALGVAAADAWRRGGPGLRAAWMALLLAGTLLAVLRPVLERMTTPRAALVLAVGSLAALATWAVNERAATARSDPGPETTDGSSSDLDGGESASGAVGTRSVAIALLIAAGGASLTVGLSGSALVAQLWGGLVAAMLALLVVALLRSDLRVDQGPLAIVTTLIAGLLAVGHAYVEVAGGATACLVAAALSAGSADAPLLRERPAWVRLASVAALAALLSGTAAWIAWGSQEPGLPY